MISGKEYDEAVAKMKQERKNLKAISISCEIEELGKDAQFLFYEVDSADRFILYYGDDKDKSVSIKCVEIPAKYYKILNDVNKFTMSRVAGYCKKVLL